MWNIFGPKKTPCEKIADLIRRGSIATSGECCDAMERFFFLKPQFDLLMYDTMAFFMSISLSEMMLAQNGATKEDYEKLRRELNKAIGQSGVENPDFFLYAMMPTDEQFGCLTLYYYRGNLDKFGISQSELYSYGQRYGFNLPSGGGFAMAVLVFYVRIIRIMEVEKIGNPSVEKLSVMKLTEIVGNHLKAFMNEVKKAF